ncbi:MAG: zinc ribbon domain-containing protein [Dehalococcoidia bacterium]
MSDWQGIAVLGVIVLVAYVLVLWVAAVVWAYRDIQTRTRDSSTQTISILLVLLFSVPGLLLYLILRPKDTLSSLYERQLEAEALLHEIREQATCPTCRRRVEDSFVLCPYCRTALRTPCDVCAKPLASGWVACPFCGADRVAAVGAASFGRVTAGTEAVGPQQAPQRPVRRDSTAAHTPPAKPQASAQADAGPP